VGLIDVLRPFGTPTNEDQAGAIKHCDADTGTVG